MDQRRCSPPGYVPLELASESQRLHPRAGAFVRRPRPQADFPSGPATRPCAAAVAGPLATDLTSGLGTIGPMARTAADLSTALDVIAGPDDFEAGCLPPPALPPARHDALKDFRVLVLDSHPLAAGCQRDTGQPRSARKTGSQQRGRKSRGLACCCLIWPSWRGYIPVWCATLWRSAARRNSSRRFKRTSPRSSRMMIV